MAAKAKTLKEIEKELILTALKKHDFNKSAAGRELGISPGTIRNKLREYGLAVREVVVPESTPPDEAAFEAYRPRAGRSARLRG